MLRGREYKGKEVAVKKFKSHEAEMIKEMMNEMNIMSSLNHPNIVKCYGYSFTRDGYPLLIMERAEKSLALSFREETLGNVK